MLSERLEWAVSRRIAMDVGGPRITKRRIAEEAGVSPPAVNYWFADTNGIQAEAARNLAKFLLVDPVWLEKGEGSPERTLFPGLEGARQAVAVKRGDPESRRSNITAIHPDDPHPEDVVYVPESRIEFSAGNGRTPVYELIEDVEPATYRLSWFQRERINPDRVRRFRVSGDSMEPMLFPRDTILVNEDETNIVDGKLYAIRYGDDLRVKYLSRRLDGTVVLRSVNPAYKDEEVPPELAQEHISVIGRVRDKSGKGGL